MKNENKKETPQLDISAAEQMSAVEKSAKQKFIRDPDSVLPLVPQALREVIALIRANGGVVNSVGRKELQPANHTAIAAAQEALELGAKMADGTVYAGLTPGGTSQIFAMPVDLPVLMTFNDAAKAVQELNGQKAFGHDDWQIPSLEGLRVLYKIHNEGALKGTFNTVVSGSDGPGWYWSSTEYRDNPSYVWGVRFSEGSEVWHLKDTFRLSCRPVRLVAASARSRREVSHK
jgi:hypothetical protein